MNIVTHKTAAGLSGHINTHALKSGVVKSECHSETLFMFYICHVWEETEVLKPLCTIASSYL